jgi:NADPH-dependent 2,4-dienoyl-CoA reductase/sulfur reductase-like enzyme
MNDIDIAVLGGGEAGCAAASCAASLGASVMLLDEAMPADPCHWTIPADGVRVWGVGRQGDAFRLDGIGPGGPVQVVARALVVCIGAHVVPNHASPACEVTRLLGATHLYSPARGGWVPVLEAGQRTSIRLLYAAGDCAGLGGVPAREGNVAARAALHDLGFSIPGDVGPDAAADQSGAVARFADACARLPADAVVCPCEGTCRAAIDAAVTAGARDINQLKSFTRAGMGPCQGRKCAELLGELVGLHVGGRAHAGAPTARLPLRPVPMAALLGIFDYADIPVPAPAPI